MHAAPRCLVVAVNSRKELDAVLDEAVQLPQPAAITEQVGISVMRLALGRYKARLDSNVPAGLTLETVGERTAMNGRQSGLADAPAGSVFNMVCAAARETGCSLRRAALNAAPGKNGLKESLTECEVTIFLSLARGDRVTVRDHKTGALWRGQVDLPFPEHGFIWVITEAGERRLLDIGVHTLWRPEESGPCDRVLREAGHLKPFEDEPG